MSLNKSQQVKVQQVIKTSLRKKFLSYNPETKHMPFHYRLLGKDRMALFSFIHSLNTTFGTSIFEPVAITLASSKFRKAERQYVVGDKISEGAQREIQNIIDDLSTGIRNPNKLDEIERIRKVCKTGAFRDVKPVKVDIYLENNEGIVHLFDIKTAKPNISNFKDFKRTLLEWVAIYLAENPEGAVNSCIAIPYNPYAPRPYERWTIKGMLDLENELKVAEEFWDFLGGEGAYDDLLFCFEMAGIELRPEIDTYFSKFQNKSV